MDRCADCGGIIRMGACVSCGAMVDLTPSAAVRIDNAEEVLARAHTAPGPAPLLPTRRRGPRRALVLLVAAAVVVAVSVAVLRPGSSMNAGATVASAATSTAAAGAATFTITGSVHIPGHDLQIAGKGQLSSNGQQCSTSVSYLGLPGLGASDHFDEVVAGGSIYLGGPLIAQNLPGGKAWIGINASQVAGASGLSSSMSGFSSPEALLSTLRLTRTQVQELGPTTEDGVAVDRYVVHLDGQALRQEINARHLTTDAANQVLAMFDGGDLNLVVSVGSADHLVHRISFTMNVKVAGQATSASVAFELGNFGSANTISVPASSTVLWYPKG